MPTREPERIRYWIVARDKPALLRVMMRELAGDARISFEGDLSRCDFDPRLHPSVEERGALARATMLPTLDFVVLPLDAETVQPILDVVLPDRRYMDDIIHIQIERRGHLAFGCYDNFHPECIGCSDDISPEFLDRLYRTGVIKSWTKHTVSGADHPG